MGYSYFDLYYYISFSINDFDVHGDQKSGAEDRNEK
jgi:hypothetical protein